MTVDPIPSPALEGDASEVHVIPPPPEPVTDEAGWHTAPAHVAYAKLVVKRGGAPTDVEFALSPPSTIGRFDASVGPIDVDLGEIPEGAYVSRKHARIDCNDDVWTIKDLGSSNGTFLLRDEFERVEEAELTDGVEIALGNARFVFHLSTA